MNVQIGPILEDRGHWVRRVGDPDTIPSGSDDHAVARFANDIRAIVVTHNAKDYRKLVNRRARKDRPHAGVIIITCPRPETLRRIFACVETIEHDVAICDRRPDRRVIITLCEEALYLHR